LRCRERQIGRHLALGGNVAHLDSAARADPFIRGVNPLRQLIVRQNFFWQITATTDNH
jgi:hypothetical protein